jgi:hypothetical protein
LRLAESLSCLISNRRTTAANLEQPIEPYLSGYRKRAYGERRARKGLGMAFRAYYYCRLRRM